MRDQRKVILITNKRMSAGTCVLEELAVPWKAEAGDDVGLDKLEKPEEAAWEGRASGIPEGPQVVPGPWELTRTAGWGRQGPPFLLQFAAALPYPG